MIRVSQADVVYIGPGVGRAEVLGGFLENRDPVFIRLATELFHEVGTFCRFLHSH